MEMKKINSGRLRAIGYDVSGRRLRVRFADGTTLEYAGVGREIWQRLSATTSAWSYYRDNIEEEFAPKPVASDEQAKKNPLDDLFGK